MSDNEYTGPRNVTVTGIDIPMGDLAVLLLKLVVASIPAGLLYLVLVWFFTAFAQGWAASGR